MSGCKKKCQNACQTSCQADDPEFDATDAAHPAWWRGCDYGAEMTVQAINQVMDTLESSKEFTGYFGSASLEALKNRLKRVYSCVDNESFKGKTFS
jgi:hypothetical protein